MKEDDMKRLKDLKVMFLSHLKKIMRLSMKRQLRNKDRLI